MFTIVLNTQQVKIFFLDWHQVVSYGVSLLNISRVVNSSINLVTK
jgi:hypothetical protein